MNQKDEMYNELIKKRQGILEKMSGISIVSNSNPGPMMALRSLKKMLERVENELILYKK